MTAATNTPWITNGPICRDSGGYSLAKATAVAVGAIGRENAKEECEVSDRLTATYKEMGFTPHYGENSFLVPHIPAYLPDCDSRGRTLRGSISGQLQNNDVDPDEVDWIARRMGQFQQKELTSNDPDAGGTLVAQSPLGESIDLQRNMEAFASAGASEISLPPNGRVQFPKLTAGSSAFWVGEGAAIIDSTPETNSLDLQAKKLGVLVEINNELLRFGGPATEAFIRHDMARSSALQADLAMLQGSGSTQIKGLITYGGINEYTATTVGTDGNTFEPEDIALMEAKLPDEVISKSNWLMRKQMYASLVNLRSDSVTANDGKGPFLLNSQNTNGLSAALCGKAVVRSSQISAVRSKGAANDLTYILFGYFPDWVIARLGVMEFLSGNGGSALTNDMTHLRGVQHIAAGPRHEQSFVFCDDLVV